MNAIKYVFLLLTFFTYSQEEISARLIKKTKLEADKLVHIDNFDSKYFIKNNVLYLNKNNDTFEYNNFQLGDITSVSAYNPLKINLFYKDFNTVIILDNRLAEISKQDFNTTNSYKYVTHVTSGNDNTIWIFNQNLMQLELYDYINKKSRVTTLPISEKVLDITSNYNFCWLLTTDNIYTYNYFGSNTSKIENDGYKKIKEQKGDLYLQKENSLYLKRKNTDQIQEIELPELLIKQFFVTNETLYIYDGETLHQYQLLNN